MRPQPTRPKRTASPLPTFPTAASLARSTIVRSSQLFRGLSDRRGDELHVLRCVLLVPRQNHHPRERFDRPRGVLLVIDDGRIPLAVLADVREAAVPERPLVAQHLALERQLLDVARR